MLCDKKIYFFKVDVNSGTSVTFEDAYEKSKNIANALAKLGFKQGDVLYFVTFEMAQLYVVDLAVWLLGGAIRGCYQREAPGNYSTQN
jgi:long-subunit acyl-CoA synthetase (AMP-forming)